MPRDKAWAGPNPAYADLAVTGSDKAGRPAGPGGWLA